MGYSSTVYELEKDMYRPVQAPTQKSSVKWHNEEYDFIRFAMLDDIFEYLSKAFI